MGDLPEPKVGQAAGASHFPDDVRRLQLRFEGVLPDVVQRLRDANVALLQPAAGSPANDGDRLVGDVAHGKSVDGLLEQLRHGIAGLLEIRQDARERRREVVADELVVVDADEQQVAGDFPAVPDGEEHGALRGHVVCAEDPARLRQRAKVARPLDVAPPGGANGGGKGRLALVRPEGRRVPGNVGEGGRARVQQFPRGEPGGGRRIVRDGGMCPGRRRRVLVEQDDGDVFKEIDGVFGERQRTIDDAADGLPQIDRFDDFFTTPARVHELYLPPDLLRKPINAGKLVSPALGCRCLEKKHYRRCHALYDTIIFAGSAIFSRKKK